MAVMLPRIQAVAAERSVLSKPATPMLLIRVVKTLRPNLTGSSRIEDGHGPRP
jgi:hypothetical protein